MKRSQLLKRRFQTCIKQAAVGLDIEHGKNHLKKNILSNASSGNWRSHCDVHIIFQDTDGLAEDHGAVNCDVQLRN